MGMISHLEISLLQPYKEDLANRNPSRRRSCSILDLSVLASVVSVSLRKSKWSLPLFESCEGPAEEVGKSGSSTEYLVGLVDEGIG
ncbi:hypothetical protein Plhal304r1_c012g0046641 [Plasmopara halstedii]